MSSKRAVTCGDRHFGNGAITNGLYADSWNMIPGAGWLSVGPGYRHWYSKDRMYVDESAAISSRGYKTAQARFELPRLVRSRRLVGSQARWQDYKQVSLFGEGPDSVESNLTQYRLESTNFVGFATLRPFEWLDIDTKIGWLDVSALSDSRTVTHTEAAITADSRDFPGHPTPRAAWSCQDFGTRTSALTSIRLES